jgi:hypothetical protein
MVVQPQALTNSERPAIKRSHQRGHEEEQDMRKTFGIIAASALAIAAFSAPAAAAPNDAACFGQIHKIVNTQGFAGYNTVGELVQASEGKGQGKNTLARSLCAS